MRPKHGSVIAILGLAFCTCLPLLAQECPEGGIHFSSQAELDAFPSKYPDCTSILGNLTISEKPQEAIVNLSGLAQIESVIGSFNVSGNRNLKDLDGLQNLRHLGASVRIANNSVLQNIKALGFVNVVLGDLSISSNARLSSLKGLQNLTSIKEHLIITDNKSLPNLEGLEKLQKIGRDLLVQQNSFLQSLVGLDLLDTIGAHVVIDANDNLSSLKGLNNLSYVRGNLQVVNNPTLSSIAALEDLRYMGGLFQIFNNPFLRSLAGIDSISGLDIGDVAILFSPTLSTCHVRSICEYLADPANQAAIRNNANGCGSREEILASCQRDPVNSTPRVRGKSSFYPNPTNGFVTIRGTLLKNATYHVTDLVGKRCQRGDVSNNLLDLTQLASGTYVVEVTTNEGEEYRELVIKM